MRSNLKAKLKIETVNIFSIEGKKLNKLLIQPSTEKSLRVYI